MLTSIIGIFLTIFLIIGIHELGHFLAARWLGVKVLRFSIGFGKGLYRRTDKKGTEYVLAAIPLGGYVKMLDEGEEEVPKAEKHLAFNRQPFYKKFLIVAAGPFANFILAFFIYWILFIVGFTSIAPIVGQVTPNSIAEQAGMKPQQEIVRIDDKKAANWMSVAIQILSHSGDSDHLKITTKDLADATVVEYALDLSHWKMNELKPDPIGSLGIVPYELEIAPVIGTILSSSPASQSDLMVGDRIIAVDKQAVTNWIDFITYIEAHPAKQLSFTIERNGKVQMFLITTSYQRDLLFRKHGFLGVTPEIKWPENFLRENKYGPLTALSHAWQNTYDFTYLNFMIVGKLLTGKVSLQSLGGPISIFSTAGTALNQGLIAFASFLAFLSISIGIVNIFPIPGLDGGHILFQTIEAISRRPLTPRVQTLLYRIGVIFLLLIITQAVVNDLLRLSH